MTDLMNVKIIRMTFDPDGCDIYFDVRIDPLSIEIRGFKVDCDQIFDELQGKVEKGFLKFTGPKHERGDWPNEESTIRFDDRQMHHEFVKQLLHELQPFRDMVKFLLIKNCEEIK